MTASADARCMALALGMARRGLGQTAPNPCVGAVIVNDDTVLAVARTNAGGRPHAETEALGRAGEAARGATLYVTLEPCAHHGRTPPCAEAIIAAGIARVVAGITDPDARVAGQGLARLRAAGVRVEAIPGPSAILATLAASGFPADTFLFLGFAPTRSKDRALWLARLCGATGTVVFFEAPHRLRRTLSESLEASGDLPAVVGRELTKVHEELVRGPITSVLEAILEPRGEFTVALLIGQTTENGVDLPAAEAAAVADFGLITELAGASRRTIAAALAKKHGLQANHVYALLEAAKGNPVS